MTHHVKKIGLVLIIILTTFFSSCEKDLYEEAIVSSKKSIKIRKVSLNDVSRSNNPELYRSIDQLKAKQEKALARLVYDSINNFYYDDENGKVIEDELGVKSYTFPVYRENSDGKIENVFFSKNINGTFNSYLLKYNFSNEDLQRNPSIAIQAYNTEIIILQKSIEYICITTIIYSGCSDTHSNGVTCSDVSVTDCYNTGSSGDSSGGTTGVDPIGDGTIGDGGTTGGGGTNEIGGTAGSSGTGSAYTTPVPTVITHEEVLRRKFFVQQILTNDQETFFNSLSSDIKNSIFQYLADNSDDLDSYSQDAIDFAQEVVDLMMDGGNTLLNPNNLDDQITANLDPCVFNILNEIKTLQNGKFGEVMKQFIGVNPLPVNYNWDVNSAVLPTDVAAITTTISGALVRTTMNEYYTEISTDLSVARTLIHEAFHAYLNAVYRNRNIDMNYVNLINLYSTEFGNNLNTIHHHLFAEDKIISHISEALMEYGNLKGYNLTQQYCDDMAWAGLLGTYAYSALPQSQKDRIESTLLSESLNNNQNPQGISPVGTKACP
jgi:hypothetical protein